MPRLEQPGQILGIDLHCIEIPGDVGQRHEIGELGDDLDFMLGAVTTNLFEDFPRGRFTCPGIEPET